MTKRSTDRTRPHDGRTRTCYTGQGVRLKTSHAPRKVVDPQTFPPAAMDYAYRRSSFMDDTVFRSSPSSLRTYAIDARDFHSPRTISAFNLDDGFATDYFSLPFESSYRAFSPFYDDRLGRYYNNDDLVRRNNRESAMANGSIMRLSRYVLVHPMMCSDGGYPTDFQTPRPLEDFLEMGDGQLDRILAAYELTPSGSWYERSMHDDLLSARYGYGYSQPRRLPRLVTLFEYLGAYRLAEQLRWRRPGLPMGLPRFGMGLQ